MNSAGGPAQQSLDGFLQQLRQGGDVESKGAFTVSLQTAEEKLQKFQLWDPSLYIVQMVATAVAAGASFLHIDTDLRQIEFLCDGQAPTRDELEQMSQYLFYSSENPAFLSELAVGVQGSLALPVKRVLVESFSEESSWQLEMRPGKHRISPLSLTPPVIPLLRVVVDKGFGLRTRILNRHPEQSMLSRCRFAPLELKVDEEVRNTAARVPGATVAWTELRGPGGRPQLEADIPPLMVTEDAGVGGFIAIVDPSQLYDGALHLVHHGVDFPRSGSLLGGINTCGLVHLAGMRKDISHSNLVENSEYEEMMAYLRRETAELYVRFCREPLDTRKHWGKLRYAVQSFLENKDLTEDHKMVLSDWLRFANLSDTEQSDEYRLLIARAKEMKEAGEVRRARELWAELYATLTERALERFRLLDWNPVQETLGLMKDVLQEAETADANVLLQGESIVNCLLYQHEPPDSIFTGGWGAHRKALIMRYRNRLVEAAEEHGKVDRHDPTLAAWAYRFCGEIELARANYKLADDLFDLANETELSRDLLEEQAFLKRLVSERGRAESVKLLQRALLGPEREPYVNWLFLDWLAREGRGILSWDLWVEIRAKASVAEIKTKLTTGSRAEIEKRLDLSFNLLGWKSLARARDERTEAVARAEKEFGPNHPYTQFSRRRAIYQLHRLEDHETADKIQCRGHLLAQFERCLSHNPFQAL